MKKIFVFLMSIMSFSFFLNAHENYKKDTALVISYNAQTGNATKYPVYKIFQDGYIIFEIRDINLFRYTVTLTQVQNNVINSTRLSEGNTEININPNIFSVSNLALDLPSFYVKKDLDTKVLSDFTKVQSDTELSMSRKKWEIEESVSNYKNAIERCNKREEINNKIADIDSNISKLMKDKEKKISLNKVKQELVLELSKINLLQTDSSDKAFISNYPTLKDTNTKELQELENKLNEANFNYNSKLNEQENANANLFNLNFSIENYNNSLIQLNGLSNLYHRLINVLYSDQKFEVIQIERDKIVKDVFQINEASADLILKYAYERLKNLQTNYLAFLQAYSNITKPDDTIKEINNKLTTFQNQIDIEKYQSFFLQIAKVYDAINERNFTLKYQTLIVSDNADVISYNLLCMPQMNLPSSVETKPINFKYDVKIEGGLKIDISTGIFWNFLANNNKYRFEEVTDSTTRVIKEKNKNMFIPSFGVLFNLYKRSNKNLKFGANFGISTNTEKLNYYLGLSLLFGRSERVNLNFGIVGTQVDMVSDKYDTNEILQVPIGDLPSSVPLRNPSPFRFGVFVGLSFNLFDSKNKETLNKISTF